MHTNVIAAIVLGTLALVGCNSKAKCLEQCKKQAEECATKTGDAQKMCQEAVATCPKDLCNVE